MYNVVKQNFVTGLQNEARVIDADEILQEKLKKQAEEEKKRFQSTHSEDGSVVEPSPEELLEAARIQAGLIEGKAKDDADRMMEQAKEQAGALFEEQRHAGYDAGMQQFEAEKEDILNQLQEKYASMEEKLRCQYAKKLDTMENDIVDAVIQVFDKVFHIEFEKKKEILIYLIKNTIDHNEADQNFQVRVSPANKQYLSENPHLIEDAFSDQITIEYVADPALNDEQCMIETSSGVFDCSVDTEFQNLINDLRSLT